MNDFETIHPIVSAMVALMQREGLEEFLTTASLLEFF
jgi:hypothetical protein